MPAHPADDLAAWLSAVIPPAARRHARPLAQLISAVAAGNALPAALQAYLDADRQSAAGTIAALAGQSFSRQYHRVVRRRPYRSWTELSARRAGAVAWRPGAP